MQSDCVAIFSGGLDSTTLVYDLVAQGHEPHLVSFDYGQRHQKELTFAEKTAFKLGLRYDIIDITGITHLISNSALTSNTYAEQGQDANEIEVPEGHYAEENMKLTVVPNRNMIMISIAAGVAVNNSYKFVATGVHAGDHFVYPDCRPRFIDAANAAVVIGNQGFGPIPENIDGDGSMSPLAYIQAPFMHVSKQDIAVKALQLQVPLEDTWSCYKGNTLHCGRCGTCVERLEAIYGATQELYGEKSASMSMYDPTRYEDNEFWKTAVNNG